MTAYYMNDAKFDLPDGGFVDRTVTYLVGKSPRGGDLVLLVERRPLPEGKSLRQVAVAHGQEAAQRLRGYTVISEREGEVAWLPAIHVAARWRSEGGAPIYTRRTHLALGPTWLVVTCEAPIAEREACDGHADQVLSSLRLRE